MGFLLALVVLIGAPFALFTSGGTVPQSGMGDPMTKPLTPLGPPSARGGRATIGIKSLRPLVVVGSGFAPRETVRITGAATRTLSADRSGGFTARFRGVDPCGSITLNAVGSRGSRASFNFSSLACP